MPKLMRMSASKFKDTISLLKDQHKALFLNSGWMTP